MTEWRDNQTLGEVLSKIASLVMRLERVRLARMAKVRDRLSQHLGPSKDG